MDKPCKQTNIVIKGRIPSKKNSRIIVCRGRYPYSLPSKNYSVWQQEQSWQLKSQRISKIENVKRIAMTFYSPDKKRSDLDNKSQSILDLLVDNKILPDDNWFVCPRLELQFGGVDKINPRAEIIIETDDLPR